MSRSVYHPYQLEKCTLKQPFRFYFTPVIMAKINSIITTKTGETVEKEEPSFTVGENVN